MKAILMTVAVMLCVTVSGKPTGDALLFSTPNHATEELAADQDFICSVNAIFALELKIHETGSAELFQRSVEGTITTAEKKELSSRLGYADYSSLQDHINDIGAAVIRLKEKFPELNDATKAKDAINTSVNALAKQGKITALNAVAYSHDFVCLRELYAAIVVCYRTSVTIAALNLCIRAALAEFRVCVAARN